MPKSTMHTESYGRLYAKTVQHSVTLLYLCTRISSRLCFCFQLYVPARNYSTYLVPFLRQKKRLHNFPTSWNSVTTMGLELARMMPLYQSVNKMWHFANKYMDGWMDGWMDMSTRFDYSSERVPGYPGTRLNIRYLGTRYIPGYRLIPVVFLEIVKSAEV